jgi:hypothetical protein
MRLLTVTVLALLLVTGTAAVLTIAPTPAVAGCSGSGC